MNKWISVEDRLPEVETEVLVIAVNQRGKACGTGMKSVLTGTGMKKLTRVLSRKVGGSLATITLRA